MSASVADLAARPARETIDWDCLRRVAEYREHCEWIEAKRAEVRRISMSGTTLRPIFDDAEGRN